MSSSITVNLTVNVHAGRWRQGDEEEVITKWLSRKCVICDAFLRPANKHPTCGACYSAACRSASYWAREPTGAFLSQPAAGAEAEGRPAAVIPDGAGAAGDSASDSASKPAEEAAALPVDKNK